MKSLRLVSRTDALFLRVWNSFFWTFPGIFWYSSAPARLSALNIFFCHYADLTSCLSLSIKTYFQLQVKCVCLKNRTKVTKLDIYNFTAKSNDGVTIRHDPTKSPIFCSLDILFLVHLLWWTMITVNSFMNKTRNSFIVGLNRQFITIPKWRRLECRET